jgi:hypothetical protein
MAEIDTAVSVPYQMAPLLSGNRGAVTPWFCHRDLVSATAAGLRGVSDRLSPGERFRPRSLRSVGITAAYAVGVLLERIVRLRKHVTAVVVMRHYLDTSRSPHTGRTGIISAVRSLFVFSPLAGCAGLAFCWKSACSRADYLNRVSFWYIR